MWNYGFAIPSLFILLIIVLFYFSLPRLSIKLNRTFLNILWIECAVIFFDIVSSWADSNLSEVSLSVAHFLNVCYFTFFFARALWFFIFTATVFKFDYKSNRLLEGIVYLPFCVGWLASVLSPWFGFVYNLDGGKYHSGPFYNHVYFFFYFYLALSFYLTFRYRNRIRKRHFYSMLLYNLVLLAGIIFRRMLPAYLLMDTFCLMAIIVVYLAFENPEFYLESRGSIFNATAFRDYFEENNGKLNHTIVGLVIHNYMEMRDIYGGRQLDMGITLISQYLTNTFPEYNSFYYRNGRFFVVGGPDMSVEECVHLIKNRFRHAWANDNLELYLDVAFATVSVKGRVENSDFILSTIMEALEKADKMDSEEPVVISEKEINDYAGEAALKRALENAVDNNQVEVYLQPFIEAETGKVIGAEALSRIRDGEGKLISPVVFIPVAEENGKINILGEQVFEKACIFIKNHDLAKMGMEWISVNLSPIQFVKSDLADRYAAIVEKHGVDPKLIHLEITEVSMADESFMIKQIHSLRDKGFKFALDDYGTGYSNLTRIKHYPFVDIKFDMSVVWDYCKNPDEILPAMVQTFKHMGFHTTCEGIEDENMEASMINVGCDFLQGYYYSKPLPMDDFVNKYFGCNLHDIQI